MDIIDLVNKTASPQYTDRIRFMEEIENCDPQIHQLLGAALGLTGESGEFADILKKHVYQGKDLNKEHLKKELGDVLWYIGIGCRALDMTLDQLEDLISMKLLARYADGFTVEESNNRKESDI